MLIRMAAIIFAMTAILSAQQNANRKTPQRHVCPPVSVKLLKIKPVYPVEARTRSDLWKVTVGAVIDKKGLPTGVHLLNGDSVLGKSVVAAIQQWRWEPCRLNGEAVGVETTITVNFEPR